MVRWRGVLIVLGLILLMLMLLVWPLAPYIVAWFVIFDSWRFQ